MRRRRRTGVWLPPDPFNAIGVADPGNNPISTPNQTIIKSATQTVANATGDSSTVSLPLVGDLNEDYIAGQGISFIQNSSLADVEVGYALKRVVGKIYVCVEQNEVGQSEAAAWLFAVTCGIIVRRADQLGDPLAAFVGENFVNTYDSARDPYLWRRQWLLGNSGQRHYTNIGGGAFSGFYGNVAAENYLIGSNLHRGTLQDGPHVDAKTRRTIKSEERLFLDWTVTALQGEDPNTTTEHGIVWDLRFFGRTFQSAGNRRNASR